MFDKFTQNLQNYFNKEENIFDLSQLNDPIATKISWNPVKRDGNFFCARKLIEVNPDKIVFRISITALLISLLFIYMGGAAIINSLFSGPKYVNFARDGVEVTIMFYLIYVGFLILGGHLLYIHSTPIVFDKRIGIFQKGYKVQYQIYDSKAIINLVKLDKIYAIQLLSEYCYGHKYNFYSYELNLVLDDGSRINVVDHARKNKIRKDAESLSKFLGVPVWDAIDKKL